MKERYDIELENRLYDSNMSISESTYEMWMICAEQLSITIDEYIDFMLDMEFDTVEHTLAEIEGMYREYCQQYDIPCMQVDIGNPMKLYGAI